MKRVFFPLFSMLLCTGSSSPQSRPVVAGSVVDSETRRPLAGANVVLVGTPSGTSTDSNGEFRLEASETGVFDVRVSYVGYTPQIQTVELAGQDTVWLSFLLSPTAIPAQPIVVSAIRARERETPATFSNLDRAAIREYHTTQDIPVLLSELPSTTFYSEGGNGIGYTYMNIRGFDARRIAVMINGIPQNDPEDHNVYWLDFPDLAGSLEDVQVQRGAGSAFYGPPAIGGSVNLVTANFGRERELILSSGVGSYHTRKYSASFSSGLIDNRYALHGRLSKLLSGGYRDRSWMDFNSYFLGMIRYDEDMTTQVNFYGGPIADHLAYFGIPKADVKDRSKRKANPILRNEEIENFSQPHYELFHEWRLSPTVTLNNTAFMVFGEGFFDYDGSWAPLSYYRITPEYGFPLATDPEETYFGQALIRAMVSNRQYGWLPRVTVNHSNGELIAGAEVRIHRSDHWGRLQRVDMSPVPIPEDYRYYAYKGAKNIISLYAHELLSVRPNLTVMLNIHYVFNQYRLYEEKFVGNDFLVPYHFVNPRVGVNYNWDDRWNSYLTVAYTSREPRLKNLYDAAEASTPASWGAVVPQFAMDDAGKLDFTRPLVKPESLLDVEVGTGFTSSVVRGTVNLYWMEFTDEIVKSGQVDRFGQPVTGNADRTRHIGVELEGVIMPVTGVEIAGNATISRNRIIRHTDFSTGGPISLNNNPIAGFPDMLASGRITYRHEGFSATVRGRFVGKQYTDNFRNEQNTVDPFFVADAWVTWRVGNLFDGFGLEAKVQVNNIFDALYAAYGEGDRFFVGAERNVFFNLSLFL